MNVVATTICLVLAAPLASAQGIWTQSDSLEPAAGYGASDNYFGRSVSVYHDWALVGAPALDEGGGAAHLFEESGRTWSEATVLEPLVPVPFTDFGRSVALVHGVAIVGAPGLDDLTGAVYVFEGAGAAWTQRAVLQSSSPEAGDQFGAALALDGDTLFVGAPDVDAVDVFERAGGAWNHVQRIQGTADEFGTAIDVEGSTAVIGAPGDHEAFVYHRGSSWQLAASLSGLHGNFGQSVSIAGDRIAVGAPDDFGGGAVHLFERSGVSWGQAEVITRTGLDPLIEFGHTVSLSNSSLVVGSPGDDTVLGAAYIYRRESGQWLEEAHFEPYLGPGIEGQFASYVGVYGNVVMTNIGIDDILPFGFYAGAVLIWTLEDSTEPPAPPRMRRMNR